MCGGFLTGCVGLVPIKTSTGDEVITRINGEKAVSIPSNVELRLDIPSRITISSNDNPCIKNTGYTIRPNGIYCRHDIGMANEHVIPIRRKPNCFFGSSKIPYLPQQP